MLLLCLCGISDDIGDFVIGLSYFSSFFSVICILTLRKVLD